MDNTLATKFYLTPLKRIANDKGDILHALKASETSFTTFGEAYFSFIQKNSIKGWKKHTKMQLNIAVPIGQIKFYLFDEVNNEKIVIEIGNNNYARLTIEPSIWVAFEGIAAENMLLNIASIEHDPTEAENQPIEKFLPIFL
jgi:dTDP-4-dehydrorhamnose 3,5-epimerase